MPIDALILFAAPPPAIQFKQWDRCAGSGYKVDDAIKDTDATRITSIVKVLDKAGILVGWVYSTKSAGPWVEGNPHMSRADRAALHVPAAPSVHEDAPAVRLSKLPQNLRSVQCSRTDISNTPPS